MTTDDMIIALVATGKFTLPERLRKWYASTNRIARRLGFRWEIQVDTLHWCRLANNQQAHDLCACHFAREMDERTGNDLCAGTDFMGLMSNGDSAAAIEALWRATND